MAQGVEPALDMVGFAAVFADRLMAVSGKDTLIRLPEVAERMAAGIGAWDASPELQTNGFAAVTDEIGHNLARAAAQGNPAPSADWLS